MGKHILLIEHHEPLRRLLGGYFSTEYQVTGARDAVEALAWLGKGLQPDVILAGARLPHISTSQLLATLHNSGLHAGIPVIVLIDRPEEEARFLSMGAAACVGKPFDPLLLRQRLEALSVQPA